MKKIIKKVFNWCIKTGKKYSITKELAEKLEAYAEKKKYMKKYYQKYDVDEKMVMFESFFGRQYSCSPKALYLAMLEDPQYADFKKVWAFKNPKKYKWLLDNPNTIVVKFNSHEYFKYHAMAKYLITNSRLPNQIVVKENQKYIQCWHGTPLKRLGYDIKLFGGDKKRDKKQKELYTIDAMRYTHMVSPSDFYTEKITSAFGLEQIGKQDIFIQKGYPRNDYLYSYSTEEAKSIKEELGIPLDKKVIMYAPTWRENQQTAQGRITYKLGMDFDKIQSSLGDDYVILFRAHYFVSNLIDLTKYEGFVFDVSKYDDVNHLYVISDILITDYSSVFFDYANLNRPIIFYMYDFEEYKDEMRGFYIDVDELPGPIVKEEDHLISEIRNMENFTIDDRYTRFNEKYNPYRHPCSAEVLKAVIDIEE